jgi:hypothetical protein
MAQLFYQVLRACCQQIAGVLHYLIRMRRRGVLFGHAFPNRTIPEMEGVVELAEVLLNGKEIEARPPKDPAKVSKAEELLGIKGSRPVYAFIGNLQPYFGPIGLILRSTWYDRKPHGVSRCDTGGLASCAGGFKALSLADAELAFQDIDFPHASGSWVAAFWREMSVAYSCLRGWSLYVDGRPPRKASLADVRGQCVDHPDADRRVWTWEARSFAGIRKADLVAIAVSPEAGKKLIAATGMIRPPGIKIIMGEAKSGGLDFFDEPRVTKVFIGA